MIEVNGFKVVGIRERVLGKVVEPAEGGKYKIVEYYINEYLKYISVKIAEFDIEPQESKEKEFEKFKEILGEYTRFDDIFIEETVMNELMSRV